MAYSTNYVTQLTAELDKAITQKSVTAFMADNAMRARFVGTKTVILPQVEFQGLGNYERETGFAKGAVSVNGKTLVLQNDRARSFNIDREDMDETGVAGLAGQIMGEFVRTEVAPEIDAYVLSKMYGIAKTAQTVTLGSGETLAKDCYKLLNRAIQKVNEKVGYDEELVAFINPAVYDALMGTEELSKRIIVSDFKKGELNTRVQKLNNTVLIPVPDARMKSGYDFLDGRTKADGGFSPASGAKNIGFIVMPKKAGILVKKSEKIRTFTPDKNQEMDAYKFDYRLFYDAFVKNSMEESIYVYTAN